MAHRASKALRSAKRAAALLAKSALPAAIGFAAACAAFEPPQIADAWSRIQEWAGAKPGSTDDEGDAFFDDMHPATSSTSQAKNKASSLGDAIRMAKAARAASGGEGVDPLGSPSNFKWEIPYWVDLSEAPEKIGKREALRLIKLAAESWAPCGAFFSFQGVKAKKPYGPYGPGESPEDYQPVIGFMRLEGSAGLAHVEFNSESGQPARWTLDLDPEENDAPSKLLATASHELGHAIGMDHARNHRSIMFGGSNPKISKPSEADILECKSRLELWSLEGALAMAKQADPSRQK